MSKSHTFLVVPARVGKGRPSGCNTPCLVVFLNWAWSKPDSVCLPGRLATDPNYLPTTGLGRCLFACTSGQANEQAQDSTNEGIQQSMQ